MTKHILKCQKCSQYTLEEKCNCGGEAVPIKPPKFSLDDTYASYRRKAKFNILTEKGFL
jgi:rRNA maturation protein Nop10